MSLRLHDRKACTSSERNGRKNRHFSNEFDCWQFSLNWVLHIKPTVDKTWECRDNTAHDSHWVCIMRKTFIKIKYFLVNIHLIFDSIHEFDQFLLLWLSTVKQDETYFCVSALRNKVLDCISSIEQLAIRCSHWDCWVAGPSYGIAGIIIENLSLAE